MSKTKNEYEEVLNKTIHPEPMKGTGWIIGGEYRYSAALKDRYGTALRRYDSVRFEKQFTNWASQPEKKSSIDNESFKLLIPPLSRIERNIERLIQII